MTSAYCGLNISCFSEESYCLNAHLSLESTTRHNDAEFGATQGCPPLLPNVPQQPALMASSN